MSRYDELSQTEKQLLATQYPYKKTETFLMILIIKIMILLIHKMNLMNLNVEQKKMECL